MTTETKLIRFDWALKNILRDKANFDILEGFLSAVLRDEIKVLQIVEREIEYFEKEINSLDILIKDSKQRDIVINIQNRFMVAPYLLESILSSSTKVLINNIKQNQNYRDVGKVISICILYFNVRLGKDYLYYANTEFRGLHDNQSLFFQQRKLDKTLEKFKSQDIFPEYYLINNVKKQALNHLKTLGFISITHELRCFIHGLIRLWFGIHKGEQKMNVEFTPEEVTELGKQWGDVWLADLSVDDMLAHFGPEKVLSHFKPEEVLPHFKPVDRLAGLKPVERLAGLTLHERLADLKLEDIEDYLKQVKRQQH